MTPPRLVQNRQAPPSIADAAQKLRHVFVRDLVLPARIGVRPHELAASQRIRINVDLAVHEGPAPFADKIANVVDYDAIVAGVRRIIAVGHVKLVETLAERIAAFCLEEPRVRLARVRVEKLDVYADAASVGVEIERRRG